MSELPSRNICLSTKAPPEINIWNLMNALEYLKPGDRIGLLCKHGEFEIRRGEWPPVPCAEPEAPAEPDSGEMNYAARGMYGIATYSSTKAHDVTRSVVVTPPERRDSTDELRVLRQRRARLRAGAEPEVLRGA